MELAPAGVNLTFEVTFDLPNLNVAMSVYDTSGGSATLVSGPAAMLDVVGNTYYGKFLPTQGHTYVIYKAVYTDGTFATADPNYAAGTESIIAENISGGGGGGAPTGAVIGFVIPNPTVIGIVEC